ncbi:MAG: PHP domain-containing protein [Lachnospiraceae bacterium]|nr:PHP domain-containing protein [Lachnospiraceae bacterium]
MRTVDLHAHTTASDGSLTPTELIRYAKEKGLSAIAVTDHDAVAGLDEAMAEGRRLGIRVIPGVELSTRVDGCDVHLVSLFCNWKNEAFLRRLSEMAACRYERNYKMMDKLEREGFDISRKDLERYPEGQILARGHIAQILIERGYASNLKEALRKYLSKGAPGYVEKEVLPPEECIQLIHDCGGLIFVAHLHQIDPDDPAHCVDICRRLIEMGADGLETLYCEFDDEWRRITEEIAQEYDCLRSGGSDFHGSLKKGLDLAVGYGDLCIPYSFVEAMEERLQASRA